MLNNRQGGGGGGLGVLKELIRAVTVNTVPCILGGTNYPLYTLRFLFIHVWFEDKKGRKLCNTVAHQKRSTKVKKTMDQVM